MNIRSYIAYRYPNWLDYARHMARVHRFEGWEEDLLNDVICDLLTKPEAKLQEMLDAHTTRLVNGTPTTELDKFVLKMLNMNATSPVAPFRKNTLGNKVISRADGKIQTAQKTCLNGFDTTDEDYDPELNTRLDRMHNNNIHRLRVNGFNAGAVQVYRVHFIRGTAAEQLTETEQAALQIIKQFLIHSKKTLLDD
jgi:hypothetical protein